MEIGKSLMDAASEGHIIGHKFRFQFVYPGKPVTQAAFHVLGNGRCRQMGTFAKLIKLHLVNLLDDKRRGLDTD
jgi:hypothetical protein